MPSIHITSMSVTLWRVSLEGHVTSCIVDVSCSLQAAISADSRQYNVFTFLGDDSNAANSDDDEDDSSLVPANADYKMASNNPTSSCPTSPSDSSTLQSSSFSLDDGHKSSDGDVVMERKLMQLKGLFSYKETILFWYLYVHVVLQIT